MVNLVGLSQILLIRFGFNQIANMENTEFHSFITVRIGAAI